MNVDIPVPMLLSVNKGVVLCTGTHASICESRCCFVYRYLGMFRSVNKGVVVLYTGTFLSVNKGVALYTGTCSYLCIKELFCMFLSVCNGVVLYTGTCSYLCVKELFCIPVHGPIGE